ncbi:hypothetical protein ABIC02_007564 [Bradyrhizobium sp. RT5a]
MAVKPVIGQRANPNTGMGTTSSARQGEAINAVLPALRYNFGRASSGSFSQLLAQFTVQVQVVPEIPFSSRPTILSENLYPSIVEQ